MLKYGVVKDHSLSEYCYNLFLESVSNTNPDLVSLPPSEGATKQHSFRAFHHVQLWLRNQLPPGMRLGAQEKLSTPSSN